MTDFLEKCDLSNISYPPIPPLTLRRGMKDFMEKYDLGNIINLLTQSLIVMKNMILLHYKSAEWGR